MKLWRLTTFAVLGALSVISFAETYALCIGINDYPQPLDSKGLPLKDDKGNIVDNDLRGAVNDATNMQNFIIKNYGVKQENTKLLKDKEASLAGLLEGLKWAIGKMKPGDQFMFMYSGHGTRFKGGAEEDGQEEGIVLADSQVVIDNDLAAIRDALAGAGINVTMYYDSCFSGGMAKDGWIFKRAEVAKLGAKFKVVPKSRFTPTFTNINIRGNADLRTRQAPARGQWLEIAASQEDVPSIDFPGAEGVPPQGMFSFAYFTVMNEEPNIPQKDLVDAIGAFFDDTFKDVRDKIAQKPMISSSSPDRAKGSLLIK